MSLSPSPIQNSSTEYSDSGECVFKQREKENVSCRDTETRGAKGTLKSAAPPSLVLIGGQ